MTGVVAADEGFRVAAAALPRRVRRVDDPADAVVAGRQDSAAADAVLRVDGVRGARGLADVADRPPVVLVRRFLRADVADDALTARGDAPPRVLVAECAATTADDPVLLDTLGWLRVLAGAPVVALAAHRAPAAALGAFRSADGLVATISVTLGAPESWLRVRALGETTTEVVVDAAGRSDVSTATPQGVLASPRRWESADRLGLRRALDVAGGAPVSDLAGLRSDLAAVADLVAGVAPAPITAVDPRDRRPAVAGAEAPAETGDALPGRDRR